MANNTEQLKPSNSVQLELHIMELLQGVAQFGFAMSGKVDRYEFLEMVNDGALDHQEAAHKIMQLIEAEATRQKQAEWREIQYSHEDTLPEIGKPVLCHITYDGGGEPTYAVLKRVDEDDCNWRTADDDSELSHWVNVTHWQSFAELKRQPEGGK